MPRKESGRALLCIGSDESIRFWVNGARVLDRRTSRPLTFDEDQVEVDLKGGRKHPVSETGTAFRRLDRCGAGS